MEKFILKHQHVFIETTISLHCYSERRCEWTGPKNGGLAGYLKLTRGQYDFFSSKITNTQQMDLNIFIKKMCQNVCTLPLYCDKKKASFRDFKVK